MTWGSKAYEAVTDLYITIDGNIFAVNFGIDSLHLCISLCQVLTRGNLFMYRTLSTEILDRAALPRLYSCSFAVLHLFILRGPRTVVCVVCRTECAYEVRYACVSLALTAGRYLALYGWTWVSNLRCSHIAHGTGSYLIAARSSTVSFSMVQPGRQQV